MKKYASSAIAECAHCVSPPPDAASALPFSQRSVLPPLALSLKIFLDCSFEKWLMKAQPPSPSPLPPGKGMRAANRVSLSTSECLQYDEACVPRYGVGNGGVTGVCILRLRFGLKRIWTAIRKHPLTTSHGTTAAVRVLGRAADAHISSCLAREPPLLDHGRVGSEGGASALYSARAAIL
jgi:hypothetical protein